jgi:hypothetical protein
MRASWKEHKLLFCLGIASLGVFGAGDTQAKTPVSKSKGKPVTKASKPTTPAACVLLKSADFVAAGATAEIEKEAVDTDQEEAIKGSSACVAAYSADDGSGYLQWYYGLDPKQRSPDEFFSKATPIVGLPVGNLVLVNDSDKQVGFVVRRGKIMMAMLGPASLPLTPVSAAKLAKIVYDRLA